MLATVRLLAVVLCLAGRATLLPRLTWYALYGCVQYVPLVDKRIDPDTDLRAIPVHALLREQLELHLDDLVVVTEACARLGIALARPGSRRFDARAPDRCAFSGAMVEPYARGSILRRKQITMAHLEALAFEVFDRPANVGRHTIISLGVLQEIDPWLLKMLGGHHRGDADPFFDGGMVSPRVGIGRLRAWLDGLLGGLVRTPATSSPRYVLPLTALPSRLARKQPDTARRPASRVRVLPPAWQPTTITALRIVDHLRQLLTTAEGPSHAGAQLLLAQLLLDWIHPRDIEQIWNGEGPAIALADSSAVVVWGRHSSGQELHGIVNAQVMPLLHRAFADCNGRPTWTSSCKHAAAWLRATMRQFAWPQADGPCIDAVGSLVAQWMRVQLPPYLLAASSRRLTAACANRLSLLRLNSHQAETAETEVLMRPPPKVRTQRRVTDRHSALAKVLSNIHKYCNTDNRLGEDDQRWIDLTNAIEQLDCAEDGRARLLVLVVGLNRDRWRCKGEHRVQVSSFATYMSLITAELKQIPPIEDLTAWHEEWIDWVESIKRGTRARDASRQADLLEDRLTAARHLLRAVADLGHPVPDEVLHADGSSAAGRSSRRSASRTVVLGCDVARVAGLIERHYADVPLVKDLAALETQLRSGASLRTAELGALERDSLTRHDDLAIYAVGYSHLKSPHSLRLQALNPDLAGEYRRVADLVKEGSGGSRWLYARMDDNDWRIAADIAQSHSAALQQVTGDEDARPHAFRCVAPLQQLLPGWEDMAAALVRGVATTAQCEAFVRAAEDRGVGHLVQVLVATGHGHPLTFLTYYFAIWPWMLGVYARALNANLVAPSDAVRRFMPATASAYRKARQRAKEAHTQMDEWCWIQRKVLELIELPALHPLANSARPAEATPMNKAEALTDPGQPISYVAARYMGMSATGAAHAYGLSSASAAALEALIDVRQGASLRRRHQGDAEGRGRQAELVLLRSDAGTAFAARMASLSVDDVRLLERWLLPPSRVRRPVVPLDELCAGLRRCAALLPTALGLWLQTGPNRYSQEELTQLESLKPRVRFGGIERDIGAVPRVSVIDTRQPENRVRRARLTALVRCLIDAALTICEQERILTS
jgi:hypothetical protein